MGAWRAALRQRRVACIIKPLLENARLGMLGGPEAAAAGAAAAGAGVTSGAAVEVVDRSVPYGEGGKRRILGYAMDAPKTLDSSLGGSSKHICARRVSSWCTDGVQFGVQTSPMHTGDITGSIVANALSHSEQRRGYAKKTEKKKKKGMGKGKEEGKEESQAKEGSDGEEAGSEGAVALDDKAQSIKELHCVPENGTILLRKAELEALLVEGLPTGLQFEFSPELGNPTNSYPFLARSILRKFLGCLSLHAASVNADQFSSLANETMFSAISGEGTAEGGGGLNESVSGSEEGKAASSHPRSRFLILGAPGSGKSVMLALSAAWARAHGWLVLYVPKARDWSTGGLYSPHPGTATWDTPVQAQHVLQSFLDSHKSTLSSLPLRSRLPLPLGASPQLDLEPEQRHMTFLSEQEAPSLSLADLADAGLQDRDAAVSALIRMREELQLVQGVPVLIAIDEYNSWFTFSSYFQSTGDRSRRQIHANELRMVNAFRPLSLSEQEPSNSSPVLMAAAFSETIAVGRLAPGLPGVPKGCSFQVPRFSLEESRELLQNHARRQGQLPERLTDEALLRAHYLAVGNGAEVKRLSLFM